MATYMMLKINFQKLSEIEIFRKSKDLGWILIWIINMCPRWYIWWCKQHSIIVAGFQQNCCFSTTNDVFSFQTWFLHQWMKIKLENQHLLPKSNNDAVLLAPSNIPSRAHVDNSNQNQSEILRFSKNLDYWQFLKIPFRPHTLCHEY